MKFQITSCRNECFKCIKDTHSALKQFQRHICIEHITLNVIENIKQIKKFVSK